MKKTIFAVALFCGAVVSVNAEELVSEASINEAEASVAEAVEAPEATGDTIFVYTGNPAAVEYTPAMQGAKYNYRKFVEEKGLRKWKVEAYVGNDTEPVVLWSSNREGAYIAGVGQYSNFDSHDCFGGGLEVGYLRKYFGFSVAATGSNGYEARSSARQREFTQLDVMGRVYSPRLEWHSGKSVMWVSIYTEVSFKKRKDLQYDQSSSVSYEELSDGGIDIITTVKNGRLDARPHVLGWAVGARLQFDIWGSPLSVFATADLGKSQNFSYMEKQWRGQLKAQIGLSFRLFNSHGYNKPAMQKLGYSREEVKRHNW